MEGYQGYREPPLARSPPERTSWGGRDDNYRDRTSDRPESRDTFYRGRSPGKFVSFTSLSHFWCGTGLQGVLHYELYNRYDAIVDILLHIFLLTSRCINAAYSSFVQELTDPAVHATVLVPP